MNSKNQIANITAICETYSNKGLEELKAITPHWAIGQNISKILAPGLNPAEGAYTIFWTSITDLLASADFMGLDMNKLFTGEKTNDIRIAKLLHRWDNLQFVDPPSLYLKAGKDKILLFSDGRHRTKLSYFLVAKKLPVAIRNCDIEEIRSLGLLELVSEAEL